MDTGRTDQVSGHVWFDSGVRMVTTPVGSDAARSAQGRWLTDLLTAGADADLRGATSTLTRDTTVIHLDRET